MEQGRGQSQRTCGGPSIRVERQRQSKPGKDNADIFDRAVSEHALHIILHERMENAEHRGAAAGSQNRNPHHHSASWARRSKTMRRKP